MEERRKDPAKRAIALPDDFASRPFGAILLLVALFAFGMYTYVPITEAQNQVASLRYSGKYVYIQPLLAMLGIAYLLFGEKASKVLGPTTRPSIWGWALLLVAIVMGFAYVHFLEAHLHALGYQV
jgi:hypothetical protein